MNDDSAMHYTENIALEKSVQTRFQPHNCHLFASFPTVLLKFRRDEGRDPDPQSFSGDGQLLRQIRDDVLEALAVRSDLLNDDFIRYRAPLA